MAVSKKIVAVITAAGLVVGLGAGVGLFLGLNAHAQGQSAAALEQANAALLAAQKQRGSAESKLAAAGAAALAEHTRGTALHTAADAEMLAEPGLKASLETALQQLAEAAGFGAAGSSAAPADTAASSTSTAPASPASPSAPAAASSASPTPTPSPKPQTEQAATERALSDAAAIDVETKRLEAGAKRITERTDAVRKSENGLVASAHSKAAALEIPEGASTEAKEAFAAALAALQQPAADADLAALVQAYQQSWAAVVAVSQGTPPGADPASIEPTYINGVLVVNKTYALPSWYGDGLTGETLGAFNAMQAEAASLGLHIWISSGFRSYASQNAIYNRYVSQDGRAEADRYSARPGHSEHQSGLAFDLNTIDEAFAYTPEGEWVRDNAHRFGLVIRYPQGKEHITGYMWEPWHLRYLGVGLATQLYDSGQSLEEHLGITSRYAG